MLKEKLQNQEPLFGVWQRIASTTVSEVLGYSGVDFVMIDMEHGAIDIADIRNSTAVLRHMGIPVMVRVASSEPAFISKTLDLGVDGIMIPAVETADQAREIVNASKFAPIGKRGMGGPSAANQYGLVPTEPFIQSENRRVITIAQIETKQGIDHIDEILEVEGIDLFFIGPFDLSQSLGVTGQMDHPFMRDAIQTVLEKAKATGKVVGIHGPTPDFVGYWRKQGIQFFTYGMDTVLLRQAVQSAFDLLRNEIGG